jgi:hypothetical protein
MFQSYVFLKDPSHYRRVGKGARYSKEILTIQEVPNLLLLAEGDGVTATSLGNLKVTKNYIKINRKKAPNGLSRCSNQTNKEV